MSLRPSSRSSCEVHLRASSVRPDALRLSAGSVLVALALAMLVSPRAHAGGHGHETSTAAAGSGKAAEAAPVGEPVSMDLLRQRLAERVASVRAAQPPAQAPKAPIAEVAPARHVAPHRPAARTAASPSASRGHEGHAPATQVATLSPAAAAAIAHHGHGSAGGGHAAHWSYGGDGGPAAWAQLKPEFATCGLGSRQSPIDIRGGIKVELEPIKFDYKPAGFNVIDNGHTVQVNIGGGNAIEVNGRRYDLVQFHFHRPSEERINGRQFEMVAHLVHKDLDGRLAVVAVLLDAGKAHPVVQQVWNNLPLEKNDELRGVGSIDLLQLLPEDRRYYTYMGSLTTPPCSEGVLWLVLKQPVTVTQDQVGVFARLYSNNARPIQPQGGRLIKESN